MKRTIFILFCLVLASGTFSVRAQVVPAATSRGLSLTGGGLISAFQPDYAGGDVAEASPNRLYGIGAFVDVRFTHWVQLEAEGRWLRFNQYVDINEDNYLIGPRFPIQKLHFWKATPYAKALVGIGRLNFEYNTAYGHFTDVALGGGLDVKLTRRINLRAADFEYQLWPKWVNNQSLMPYGLSAGLSYRVF